MSLVRVAMPFLVFLFLGCESTDINAYDESAVGPGETAIVRIAPNLTVDAVDGNPEWKGSSTVSRPLTIRLPPGQHTVTLRFKIDGATDQKIAVEFTTIESDPIDREIFVRAGHVYSIEIRDSGSGWRPTFREVEVPE